MAFSDMNSDRVIEAAISTAKNLLWQNLRSAHNVPDAATVTRIRELVRSLSVRSALQCSSDTFPAFALRAVEFAAADQSLNDRQIISRLRDVLDDAYLNQSLGISQDSRTMLGPYPKRR